MQGIDLITPKFHTNRHFLVGSKNIHNIAAHRELAGAIHLGPAGVAGTKQSGQQVIPQQSIPRMEGAGVGAEILFWGGELGQGFRGHSHGAQPPAYQLAQHSQAAVLVFAGGALNGAQHIVPRREHGSGNAQRVQVSSKAGASASPGVTMHSGLSNWRHSAAYTCARPDAGSPNRAHAPLPESAWLSFCIRLWW